MILDLVQTIPGFWLGCKGALILLSAGIVVRLLPRSAACLRHWIWMSALLGCLILPLFSHVLPGLHWSVLPATSSSTSRSSGDSNWTYAEGGRPPWSALERERREAPSLPESSPARGPFWSGSPGLAEVCLVLYLTGFFLLAGYLALGLWKLRWLGAGGSEIAAESRRLVEDLATRMGIRRRIVVRASPRTPYPVAWGLFRPRVLVNAHFDEWSLKLRHDALCHELAHVARRDWLCWLLARSVTILYWPIPFVWWAFREQAAEAERACDDQVLLHGTVASSYARRLLSLTTSCRPPDPVRSLVRKAQIPIRIRAILNPQIRRNPMTRKLTVTILSLGLVSGLLGAVELTPMQMLRGDDLRHAAARGDLRMAEALLDAGYDPDYSPRGDRSSLMEAARRGDLEMIELLLAAGANPDLEVPADGNALIAAVRAGQIEALQLLLDLGANPNAWVEGDGSALISAARGGAVEMIRLLLERGAEVNLVVPADENALINAARQGNLDGAILLLEAGADVNVIVQDRERTFTALGEAERFDRTEMVRLLRRYGANR